MNNILSLTYGIFYKLADELYDEEIYNNIFPNAKLIIYPILFLYNIYFFYFNDYNSEVFILTFLLEIWYIVILFLRYFDIFLVKIAEMNLTLQDPFTLLTILLLPMFVYKFYDILVNNLFIIIFLFIFGGVAGIIQDIDNSILGTYILKNKYNKFKKEYKIIYRSLLLIIILLSLNCLHIKISVSSFMYLISYFLVGYLTTSVISLIFQIILENIIENINLKEKIHNLKEKYKPYKYNIYVSV